MADTSEFLTSFNQWTGKSYEMWAYYSDNAFDQGCCIKPQNSSLLMQYLKGYYSRGVEGTQLASEKQTAAKELAKLAKSSPSEFMGEAVFRKFKSNPQEQSLPGNALSRRQTTQMERSHRRWSAYSHQSL